MSITSWVHAGSLVAAQNFRTNSHDSQPMPSPTDYPKPSPSPPGVSAPATPTAWAPRLPSLRMSAALAAGMLALGIAIGAAIGPAPSASLAGEPLSQLLPRIAAIAIAGDAARDRSQLAKTPPASPTAAPEQAPSAATAPAVASTPAGSASQATPSKSTAPISKAPAKAPAAGGEAGRAPRKPLPEVTHVWLITVTGATFTQALGQASAAPYIDDQLVPAGALLGAWSALQGSALASEAALLAGEPPQLVDSIVQPACPEGAAGAACKPETPGALTAADGFLKQVVPPILASSAYREHGLVAIVFGTIGNAGASSLPEGSSTATLSSEPPGGVLILSPFAKAGTRPNVAYEPASPRQSLSALLH
jgi:hypothetical protein